MVIYTGRFGYRAPGMPVNANEVLSAAEIVKQLLAAKGTIHQVRNVLVLIIHHEVSPSRRAEWQEQLNALPDEPKPKSLLPPRVRIRRTNKGV